MVICSMYADTRAFSTCTSVSINDAVPVLSQTVR